jgi:hypothetical protein
VPTIAKPPPRFDDPLRAARVRRSGASRSRARYRPRVIVPQVIVRS